MKVPSTLLLFLAAFGNLQAANFLSSSHPNLDGGSGDRFILDVGPATQAFLLNSGFAGTGRFTITDAAVDLAVSTDNYAVLLAPGVFNPYVGIDNFTDGLTSLLGDVPGGFAIVANGLNPGSNAGATLYTFMGNGATLAESTAIGLFRHTTAVTPDDPNSPTPNEFSPNLVAGSLLIGGSVSLIVSDPNLGISNQEVSGIQLVSLQAIPEPSALLLSALGALALLRRKR